MSSQTKINVDFVSTFNNKGTKQAHGEINKLTKSFEKLGAAFGLAFGAKELVNFAKESVKAFAADDASAKILAQTLGNLGQSIADVPVEKFITKLSELNGISKTDLRAGFDTLVRSTKDAGKAQELLNVGLDISAGTGKNLGAVTLGLAKAYAGNNASLGRLGLGLTTTQLKMNTFAENLKIISKTFKGDATTAADSYAGKMARLSTSFEEFKIKVGTGLVDAFANLSHSSSMTDIQTKLDNFGTSTQNFIAGLGVVIGDIETISKKLNSGTGGWLGKILSFNNKNSILGLVTKLGSDAEKKKAEKQAIEDAKKAAILAAAAAAKAGSHYLGSMLVPNDPQKLIDAQAKLNDLQKKAQDAAKIAKEKLITSQKELDILNKEKKAKADQLALDRAQLSLKLAGNTTDMNNIEIQAALQRGQTKQVTDVLLLQRAEIVGNADLANVLARKILEANGLVMDVDGSIKNLKTAKNPFGDWPQESTAAINGVKSLEDSYASLLKAIQAAAKAAKDLADANPGGVPLVQPPATGGASPGGYNNDVKPDGVYAGGTKIPVTDMTPLTPPSQAPQSMTATGGASPGGSSGNFSSNGFYVGGQKIPMDSIPSSPSRQPIIVDGITVQVSLDGTPLLSTITNAQVNQSASGTPSTFARSGYFGG
jgi:hypothetical protein